jgi:hypothetical protein
MQWNAKKVDGDRKGENNTMIHLRNGAEVRQNTPIFSDV